MLIGACGWLHPQWDESYYPEGLPEEWRLAYYGNEYPVVLIPDTYWSQGREVIASWLTETDNRPQFICEWAFESEQPSLDERQELIAALNDRVEGILVVLDAMPNDIQLAMIRSLAKSHPVCLDWPSAQSEQLQTVLSQFVTAQRVSVCWHGDAEHKMDLEHGELALARVPSEGHTPRSLRTILETLLASAGERQAVLLFDGQPPDLEVVDQAEVILNLL